MYVLHILGFIKTLLNLDNTTFLYLLKIPTIITDIALGVLVYKQLKKIIPRTLYILATCLIILNPVSIFNSSVWGQIDSIPTFFLFYSVLLLKNKKLILSSIFLSIAFVIKPQVLVILPAYVYFLFRNFSLKNTAKLFLPFVSFSTLISLPFFPQNQLLGIWQHIQKSADQYPYTSLFAYNFWGLIGFWIPDSTLYNSFSYQTLGLLLLFGFLFFVGYISKNKKISVYGLATLSLLGFFFLYTRIHERYLYPAIFFLIFLSFYLKSRLLIFLGIILSSIHFLNLYYVYIYYNHFFLKTPNILYNPTLYNTLAVNDKNLSLLSVVIFTLISITILSHDYKKD